METPILELKNISVIAKGKTILENINLKVPRGALIAILGESGSGKSTVLRVIAGWEKPSIGRVFMTLGDKHG
ncbi:MAG: ATP-binding cassette domain-containing protein [Alphaproteobacteria bacterium]|nr:ATP-binding cassette domain-containing protein [Alphaproteobacteria bacterium]